MIGEQLGKWKITKKLNRGGMADIYLAEEVQAAGAPPAKAAIKILRLSDDDAQGITERFQREIDVLRTLKHEHIVRLYDSGEWGGRPYLVMEYVDGLSLDQVLQQRGKLFWEEVVAIGQMVASALRYAHRQEVIHRDLKPANLLASWDRNVKLSDFGIAKLLYDGKVSKDQRIVGTASYLSPEQAAGKPATRKSDLYSFGVVLYELATGRLPFEASTDAEMLHKHRYARFEAPSRLVEEIPHDFDELIESLLEKDPDKRPPNALAVEDALLRLRRKFDRKRQYTPSPAARPTKVMAREDGDQEADDDEQPPPLPRGERKTFPWIKAASLLVALAGLLLLLTWLRQPPSADVLVAQIEESLREGDWLAAQKKYDTLRDSHGASVGSERLAALTDQINAAKTLQQARVLLGPLSFSVPKSEAERFYRRAAMAYFDGRIEEAKRIWQALITAFADVPSESAWVRLAQDALKQSDASALGQLDILIAELRQGKPEETARRLANLKTLYEGLPDSPFKQQALQKINQALPSK